MSVTAGGGHNSAANALKEYFLSIGAEAETLDTIGYVSPTFAKALNKGHLFLADHMGKVFGFGYHSAEKRTPPHIKKMTPMQIVNLRSTKKFLKHINEYKPDAILFTHCFAGIVLHLLKKAGKISVPTIGILTDFVFHPYWEDCTANDYVVMPSEALKFQGIRKGFREEQLLPLGIPISPRFASSTPKREARESVGLDPDAATILLMGGSMGNGNLLAGVKALDELPLESDFQIIVVCGANEKMHKEIGKLETKHRLLNLGFVNNVDTLMDASDVIVTKPGGLTTSEAFAKRLPMVIVNPIPGQETRNRDFLLNSGAALSVSNICGAEELVYRILTSPERRDAMLSCIEALRHPDSTREIGEFAVSLVQKRARKADGTADTPTDN